MQLWGLIRSNSVRGYNPCPEHKESITVAPERGTFPSEEPVRAGTQPGNPLELGTRARNPSSGARNRTNKIATYGFLSRKRFPARVVQNYPCIDKNFLYSGIYLFIRHDGMQPESYGPLEKQIKRLEREKRTTQKSCLPPPWRSAKCENRKWYCCFKCSRVKKQLPPPRLNPDTSYDHLLVNTSTGMIPCLLKISNHA